MATVKRTPCHPGDASTPGSYELVKRGLFDTSLFLPEVEEEIKSALGIRLNLDGMTATRGAP